MSDNAQSPPALPDTDRQNMMKVWAVLFAAGQADRAALAEKLGLTHVELDYTLKMLDLHLSETPQMLRFGGDAVTIVTRPEYAEIILAFAPAKARKRLSNEALEVLAIICYEQPVMKSRIDEIRGCNSDKSLIWLCDNGLAERIGSATSAGAPILYKVTDRALLMLGVSSVSELPPLSVIAKLDSE